MSLSHTGEMIIHLQQFVYEGVAMGDGGVYMQSFVVWNVFMKCMCCSSLLLAMLFIFICIHRMKGKGKDW